METAPDGGGIDADHTTYIDAANPYFYCASVLLVFSTLLSLSWPVVLLWSCAFGVLGSYLLFRNRRLVPNLLLHLKPVVDVHKESTARKEQNCPVCDSYQCSRHPKVELGQNNNLMPWTGLNVPETIDNSLTKFLNIIIERFIISWHRDLTKSQLFTDEVRQLARHAVCLFLHRVAKIDIPKLITGPLLQVLAAHMQLYMSVRRKLPANASPKLVEDVAMETLGSNLHIAMRGKTASFRYFRNLTRTALPLLLPTESVKSKVLQRFLEELFAAKVMIPAMAYVSSPDFLNKIVILIFDKDSRLCRVPYPPSKSVPLLEKFAEVQHPDLLQPTVTKIIRTQKLLYSFMQYMKRQHAVHILQLYMSCNDLVQQISETKMGTALAQNAHVYLDKIHQLHDHYTCHSSDQSIVMELIEINLIDEVLSQDISDLTKIYKIVEQELLDKVCREVHVILTTVFCPSFYHSQEYHDAMYPLVTAQTKSLLSADQHSLSRHFEKWRSRRKRGLVQKTSQESTPDLATANESPSGQVRLQRSSSLSAVSYSTSPPPSPVTAASSSVSRSSSFEESVSFSLSQIQVVDYEVINSGASIKKPYTIYVILSRQEKNGKVTIIKARRRYKEFVVLDSRIHQFYRNVSVHLPPKRAFHNMEKQFIESRMKELESYLQKLSEEHEIRNSQLLQSFLSDTDDISLFMPDSVGDKAGKIIKSVPRVLKKEAKGQHLDALLVSMDESVVIAPRQYCSEKRAKTDQQMKENDVIIEDYETDLNEDLSPKNPKSWCSPPFKLGSPVALQGIMDLLVYLAVNVYGVSQPKITALLTAKILAQSSVEAFFHDLISNRVELICQEHEVCELIELLKYHLFFDESPPRTQKEKNERRDTALRTVLTRPPELLVQLIGTHSFISNTTILVEGLQCQQLNKQMLFSMLDVVVCELFPELRT